MAIPANLDTVTVSGTYITADGSLATGTVSFTPTVWLRDDTGDVVVPQLPVVATLVNGEFTVELIATDDTDVDQNWAYVVTETINGATTSKTVLLPATSPTVDMAELEPVIDPTQYSDIRGPRGYSVLSGTTAPSAGTGEDGDHYYDRVAKVMYGPKTAGAWGSGTSLAGPAGPAGSPGTAATVTVGAVTTGAAGSSAAVSNSGTSTAATLNFTIPRGDTGATGSPGAAATVAVGTVTTGAPGSSAAVVNSGTANAAVLDFTIPEGDTGATGPSGADGADGLGFDGITSASSVAIGTGSKSFTVNKVGALAVGTRVRVASSSSPANYVEGPITAIASLSVTVNVDNVGGSGTISSWNVTVAGDKGAKGDTGDLGTLTGTAPVTYSSGTIGLSVGSGLATSAGALVPDFGTTSGKVAQGNDARFTDTRTPTDGSVTDAKITAGGLSPSKITGTAVVTSDSRLSDARTPTAHASSHGSAGSDPITVAQSQVTNLTTDLASKIGNALVDAKGDLVTATADNTPARLAVGANDTILTADSSTATGLRWGSAPSGLPSQTSNANRLLTTNGTSASWTNVITNLIQLAPEERFNVVASAATGTIAINFLTAGVWFYSTNATANHTINIRGDASNTLNSLLATGDAITVSWIIANGTTAYYPTTIQIDGSSVTPRWLNGSSLPTAAQANQTAGIDSFTFTIIKTAATPTYTVLGAWAQYR